MSKDTNEHAGSHAKSQDEHSFPSVSSLLGGVKGLVARHLMLRLLRLLSILLCSLRHVQGASFGLGVGLKLQDWLPTSWHIQPGLYALIGSAAMLGGVFRQAQTVGYGKSIVMIAARYMRFFCTR
jgi:hypothetical protein